MAQRDADNPGVYQFDAFHRRGEHDFMEPSRNEKNRAEARFFGMVAKWWAVQGSNL
jgi:hypothetical protein